MIPKSAQQVVGLCPVIGSVVDALIYAPGGAFKFVRDCKRAFEPFPVKKIQLKPWPKKRRKP